ncbi:MAG: EAL domain-containing protein [Alphaproteobacteria bacterium]|nr:EAL domain-containing protein [Alphaproteobacteria bacterium]
MSRTLPLRSRRAPRAQKAVTVKLNLGAIRKELGDKWERLEVPVRRFTRVVLERHVGADGTFDEDGDSFLIHLTGTSPLGAARKLRTIQKDLRDLLFGSGALTGDGRSTKARRRGGRTTDRRRRFGILDRIKGLFARRRGRPDPKAAPASHDPEQAEGGDAAEDDAPPDGSDPADGASDDSRLPGQKIGGSLAQGTRNGAAPARPVPAGNAAATVGSGHRGTVAAAAESPTGSSLGHGDTYVAYAVKQSSRAPGRVRRAETNALEAALAKAARDAEMAGDIRRPGLGFPPRGLRFIYRPMWHVSSGMLTTFTCLPACAMGPFEFVTGDSLLPKQAEESQIAMLDYLVIQNAVKLLSMSGYLTARALICLPLHYDTLTGPHGKELFQLLREIPLSARERLVYEIVDISRGLGQVSTFVTIQRLRALGRAVAGRVTLSENSFALWRKTDLTFIGLDAEAEADDDAALLNGLDQFVAGADYCGMQCYVRGLGKFSQLAAAITAGFQYVDGPAISDGTFTCPSEPLPFTLADVYSSDLDRELIG